MNHAIPITYKNTIILKYLLITNSWTQLKLNRRSLPKIVHSIKRTYYKKLAKTFKLFEIKLRLYYWKRKYPFSASILTILTLISSALKVIIFFVKIFKQSISLQSSFLINSCTSPLNPVLVALQSWMYLYINKICVKMNIRLRVLISKPYAEACLWP